MMVISSMVILACCVIINVKHAQGTKIQIVSLVKLDHSSMVILAICVTFHVKHAQGN